MLTKYIDTAMRKAHYELIDDGTIWGNIPGFQGVWGNAPTLEACREDLRGALEGWLLLKVWDHDDDIPVLGKLSLNPRRRKNAAAQSS
jgi:predicted RNase H-like HicB family nuclease